MYDAYIIIHYNNIIQYIVSMIGEKNKPENMQQTTVRVTELDGLSTFMYYLFISLSGIHPPKPPTPPATNGFHVASKHTKCVK